MFICNELKSAADVSLWLHDKLLSLSQSLDRTADDDNADDDDGDDDDDDDSNESSSCLAYRTRSKLRLVNVPLDRLEAELLAPDITADMYEQNAPQGEEDHHWTKWLQGLMAPDNEGWSSGW